MLANFLRRVALPILLVLSGMWVFPILLTRAAEPNAFYDQANNPNAFQYSSTFHAGPDSVFATNADFPRFRAIQSKDLAYLNGGAGGVPTCALNCATGSDIRGNDTVMIYTVGTGIGPKAGFRITFANAWPKAPACIAQAMTTAANYVQMTTTDTASFTVTTAAGPTSSDKYGIHCIGTS